MVAAAQNNLPESRKKIIVAGRSALLFSIENGQ
jgi:hypothetical protein